MTGTNNQTTMGTTMTLHTRDIHHFPGRAPSSSTDVDRRTLGPMALGMRERANHQGAYATPAESDYFVY